MSSAVGRTDGLPEEPTTDSTTDSEPAPDLTAAPSDLTTRSTRHLRDDLIEAVGRAVVGAEEPVRLVLTALLADGHVLVEDVPGTGKTLLARAIARALDLRTNRIQGTPDLLPVDVTGSSLYEGGSLRFAPGPVFTNILLMDEINRATPRTQAALLEAMQERQVSIEGQTRPLPEPFVVLATQNPIEFEGTFALPQAQLDRFLVRIGLGYPDVAGERSIARRHQAAAEPLDRIEPIADGPRLLALRDEVRRVRVADEVEAYLVSLVRATRLHPDIQLGASPRATVALYRAAQATALLQGRSFVLPDDVKAIARPVLAHRLVVDLDQSLRGASAEAALDAILDQLPVPPVTEP
jgi:MoxR-like ATPase